MRTMSKSASLALALLVSAYAASAQGPVPPQERRAQPDVLELGSTIVNLTPGATQRMGARINVAPGTREYLAQVDWDNAQHETALQQVNNSKRLVLSIPKTPVRP